MAALSREELARAKFCFSIYDFEGCNKIDAFQLGNALRALNLTPSLKRISSLGGTVHRNEKMLDVEEFLAIYQDAKKDKKEGSWEEYMEVLSSHDKDKCGKISAQTLCHLLQGYGEERLPRDEAEETVEEAGQPDDERMVDYKKFLKNIMEGPEIKIPIAMLRATETETDSGMDSSATTPIASLSRKSTRKTVESTTSPLDEAIIEEKLSSASERRGSAKQADSIKRRGSDKPRDSLPSKDNEIDLNSMPISSSANQGEETEMDLPSKTRNSQKSRRGSEKKEENSLNAGSADKEDIISGGDEGTTISSTRSSKTTGKRSSKKATSSDPSLASDTSPMSARSSLKSSTKSRSSTKSTDGKDETPSVKAKFQQPLLHMKTEELFGQKK